MVVADVSFGDIFWSVLWFFFLVIWLMLLFQIFGDLFQLSSYLIPRSELPPLPPELKTRKGFDYASRPAP